MLLFAKLSKMTSYVLNSSEQISKIINLIANDLTVLEARAPIILHTTMFPMMIIGVTIILYIRIGWPSLIGILIIIISIPVMLLISAKNGAILKAVNALKDKRVQITTETIEGIKQVKTGGWEHPFREYIRETREN